MACDERPRCSPVTDGDASRVAAASRAGSVRSATKLPPPKYPSAEPLQLLGLPTWLEAAEVAPAPGADGADGAGAGAARPAKMVAAVLQLMLDPAQSHDVHHNAGEVRALCCAAWRLSARRARAHASATEQLLKMVVQWAPNRGLPILEDSGLTLVQATLSMGQEGEDSSAVVEEDTEPSAPVSQLRGDVAGRWSVGALLRAANSAEAPSARDAAVAVLVSVYRARAGVAGLPKSSLLPAAQLALLERVNSPAPSSASASAPSAPRLMAVVPCLVDSLSEVGLPAAAAATATRHSRRRHTHASLRHAPPCAAVRSIARAAGCAAGHAAGPAPAGAGAPAARAAGRGERGCAAGLPPRGACALARTRALRWHGCTRCTATCARAALPPARAHMLSRRMLTPAAAAPLQRALAPCLYWFFALPNHSLLHHEVTAMLAPLLRGATGAAAGDLAHDCALRGATLALQEQLLVELELPQRVAAVLQGVDVRPRAARPRLACARSLPTRCTRSCPRPARCGRATWATCTAFLSA